MRMTRCWMLAGDEKECGWSDSGHAAAGNGGSGFAFASWRNCIGDIAVVNLKGTL